MPLDTAYNIESVSRLLSECGILLKSEAVINFMGATSGFELVPDATKSFLRLSTSFKNAA